MAAYTTIDDSEAHFQVKLYTGDGASSRAVTLDGDEDMQVDLIWIKERSSTSQAQIADTVRGYDKRLQPDSSDAEDDDSSPFSDFKSLDSDGWTMGDGGAINEDTQTYVAWCWKESADAGFDIVSYTGNATNRTISHSLSAVPEFMMGKKRSASGDDWFGYHVSTGNDKAVRLNTNGAAADNGSWNDTTPTSSVFTLGNSDGMNADTQTFIIYLFAPKQGFSKFGSFVANSNTDGPFIYTGFRPAMVIGKVSSDTNNWFMFDNKRSTFNPVDDSLYPNTTAAENTNHVIDFLSNGFKIRDSDGTVNSTGNTYIYAAFAEAPFVNSNGVPCNAR